MFKDFVPTPLINLAKSLLGARSSETQSRQDRQLALPARPKESGMGDRVAQLLSQSDPVRKLAQKGVDTSLRSFHRGELICVNVAQNTAVFYLDSSQQDLPWKLSSPSPTGTVIRNAHLENVVSWVRDLDASIVELVKLSALKHGILIEHLSRIGSPATRGVAQLEYEALHDNLKTRAGGFDTTSADQFKLALGPDREIQNPRGIRMFRSSALHSKAVMAGLNGTLEVPPSMLVNLSFSTFYYLSVHADNTRDVAIDRVVATADTSPSEYENKIRNLLGRLLDPSDQARSWLSEVAAAQGALLVALPIQQNLRELGLKILSELLRTTKVDCSRVRGMHFYVQELE